MSSQNRNVRFNLLRCFPVYHGSFPCQKTGTTSQCCIMKGIAARVASGAVSGCGYHLPPHSIFNADIGCRISEKYNPHSSFRICSAIRHPQSIYSPPAPQASWRTGAIHIPKSEIRNRITPVVAFSSPAQVPGQSVSSSPLKRRKHAAHQEVSEGRVACILRSLSQYLIQRTASWQSALS